MNRLLRKYVKSCDTCARSKAPRHRPFGLLRPLSIPSRPWGSIAMDFITNLPIVKAKNSILDVVNCLTKMAHFTLVPSQSRQKRQLSQFWTGLSNYMDSLRKLCPIEALNLHPSSGGAYSSSLESTFGYPQLSTPRQMDKSNGQTRHSSNTFVAL